MAKSKSKEKPEPPPYLSVEGAVAVLAAIIPAVIDMDWVIRLIFVLIAIGLISHVAWRMPWTVSSRVVGAFIAITILVVFSWGPIAKDFRKERSLESQTALRATPAPQSPSDVKVAQPSGKTIIDVTPDYLMGIYNETRTQLQADTLAGTYRGKWMMIYGPVRNITPSRSTGTAQVVIDLPRPKGDKQIYMYFEKPWFERLSTVGKGKNISAVCQIDRVTNSSLSLDNCELVVR